MFPITPDQLPNIDLTLNPMIGRTPPAPVMGAPDPSVGMALQALNTQAEPVMSPLQRAMQALQQDQALQLGLLSFGLNMLQPVQPGQSSIGHAAQAMGAGVGSFGAERKRQSEQALQERKLGQVDRQIGQTDRRIDIDAGRLGLEERRVRETEATGSVQRDKLKQDIEQNQKAFPKTIEKLDAEINRLVSQGKVDEAQAEFLRERARLYPREVKADLLKARAAMASATKPTGQEVLFSRTAQAMVDRGEVETLADAEAQLGKDLFGKAGGKAPAAVQTAEDFERTWRRANEKRPDETPEQYEQRAARAKLTHMETKRGDDFLKAYNEWRANQFKDEPEIVLQRRFAKDVYATSRGKDALPAGLRALVDMPDRMTREQIRAYAKQHNKKPEDVEELIRRERPWVTIEGK